MAGDGLGGEQRPLTSGQMLVRFAAIGAVVLVVAGVFGFTAGWFSPARLSPERLIAVLDPKGVAPGFRANHAKGLCGTGWFDSNGQAARLSFADVFKPGRVRVVARFALSGGMPFQADDAGTVRSLALRFLPEGGAEWRTGMINIPVFPARSAQGFYDVLTATAPDPATGKPDPAKIKALLTRYPETAKALGLIQARTVSSGFADATFNGLNAFRFVDAQGGSAPVRWSVVPAQPASAGPASPGNGPNYLFDDLIKQQAAHPLQWRLVVTVGHADDPTSDATVAWPPDRTQLDAGTVTIDRLESEDGGPCTAVNYDPMVLPPGITASDDPLPSARSATYSRSFTLRAETQKAPSAITPAVVQAGGRS